MEQKTKIYLNYLSNDEKIKMTDALWFLRSEDKESRSMFERIVNDIYGPDRKFDYPSDNGHRPSESTSKGGGGKYYHTIIQFEYKHLTEEAIKVLGSNEDDEYCWRYFYAIAIGKEDRQLYLLSFSNACSPNWNNEYNVQRKMELKDVDFQILTRSGLIYRMCDSLHAAINDELWSKESTFSTSTDGIRLVVKDQHGNYATIEGKTLDDVFRDYADNYTGYRNYRRQMASEWEIVNDKAKASYEEWKKTAKGLKSDFDKFYGGGIVD
jgi:hypothetical protein